MRFLHLKCLLSGLSEDSLSNSEYPPGRAFQVFTRGLLHFHLLVLGLAPQAGHHGQGCPCHYEMLTFLPE